MSRREERRKKRKRQRRSKSKRQEQEKKEKEKEKGKEKEREERERREEEGTKERREEREKRREKREERREKREKKEREREKDRRQRSPCVDSKRLRVYVQDVSVCTGTRPACSTHAGLLPVHTEASRTYTPRRFEPTHGAFSACQASPHTTHHTHAPPHHTHHHTTTHTTTQHHTTTHNPHNDTTPHVDHPRVQRRRRHCAATHSLSRGQHWLLVVIGYWLSLAIGCHWQLVVIGNWLSLSRSYWIGNGLVRAYSLRSIFFGSLSFYLFIFLVPFLVLELTDPYSVKLVTNDSCPEVFSPP